MDTNHRDDNFHPSIDNIELENDGSFSSLEPLRLTTRDGAGNCELERRRLAFESLGGSQPGKIRHVWLSRSSRAPTDGSFLLSGPTLCRVRQKSRPYSYQQLWRCAIIGSPLIVNSAGGNHSPTRRRQWPADELQRYRSADGLSIDPQTA